MNALVTLVTYAPLHAKRRLGRLFDGGYIVVTDLTYDALLTCGINDDVSFECAFSELYPHVPGFAFDGTVDCPAEMPCQTRFHKHNIGPENNSKTTNLKPFLEYYKDVFLKMDIEGHEWAWLLCLEPQHMLAMKQVVIEVHELWDTCEFAHVEQKMAALRKLSATHYLVHAHGNNCSELKNGLPRVLELTYVRKDVGMQGFNTQPFPIPGLDFPNDTTKQEYSLNAWPFVAMYTAL